jgi:hypothetical protein
MTVLSVNKSPRRPPAYKPKKQKAVISTFQGFGPVRIEDAYDELTHHGFAVWMRLVVAETRELQQGRTKLAKWLGYSQCRSNTVLRELKRKGYISFVTNGAFRPTEVFIERKPILVARNQFVRLA